MDVGFWAARVHSSKNLPFALSSRHYNNNINHHQGRTRVTRRVTINAADSNSDLAFCPMCVPEAELLLVSMSASSGSSDYWTEEGEERTSGDEECSGLDWHVPRTEKILEKPNNSTGSLSYLESLKLSLEKLKLSCRKRNLLSNSSDISKLEHCQEVEKKPLYNVLNIKFEDASDEDESSDDGESSDDSCDDEESNDEEMEIKGKSCEDDDTRVCIACPLCDVDIEVVDLHSHLQEDHGFELKNAVCPLCAANLGKDVIGHFITSHTSTLKFKRKSKTSGLWTTSSAMLGKELSSFLGSSTNGKRNALESASDPLLSPFLSHISDPEHNKNLSSESSGYSSSLSSPSKRNNGVDYEESRQRAAFVRQLIASSIF